MSAPLLTPGFGGALPKPAPYDPLSSIQAPKPKPEPQKPVVPLVVYTAFDAQTAEELKTRLEETIHPVDRPSPGRKPQIKDPRPSEQAERPNAVSKKLDRLLSSELSPPDVEAPDITAADLETGETLFVRYGDKHSVTLQEWHQRLAEGRNTVVIHNHPNNSGASLADQSAAAWLDAEHLLIVNPGKLVKARRDGAELQQLADMDCQISDIAWSPR